MLGGKSFGFALDSLFRLGIYEELLIATFIESTKSCAAFSISLDIFKDIFKLVLFSQIVENFFQSTGPLAREGRGGLQINVPFIFRMTEV
jgi:hypothetical protein